MRSMGIPTLSVLLLAACGGGAGGNGKAGKESTTGPDGPGTTDEVPTTATEAYDPGRKTLHRLNRFEYDNTVRDLLGTSQTPAVDTFPVDDFAAGYDNIAANLSTSPLHLEMYESAALSLGEEVFDLPLTEPFDSIWQPETDDLSPTTGGVSGQAYNLWSNGTLTAVFDAPEDGTYILSTRAWGQQAGPDLARLTLGHDGFVDLDQDVAADSDNNAEVFEVEVELTAGIHTVEVAFVNDYYDPDIGADRNLLVDWVGAYGPTDAAAGENPLREALVPCDPDVDGARACASTVFADLAEKAWRRPLEPAELDSLLTVFDSIMDDGGTFEDGLTFTLAATLLSPHFTYRVDLEDDPESMTITALNDFEIASRLSYMLWSSMPDDELFRAAKAGELQTDAGIEEQVRRMLDDPKAESLVTNFAGQWLYFRAIDDLAPDPTVYPEFNDVLRASMKVEAESFMRSFLHSDRDMRELLSATEGQIDSVLAAHYGLAEPSEPWATVNLAGVDRGGLLGMAGILAVNSYPARTSPVIRGKYVLGQLMCDEPPPPPPGVEGLEEDENVDPQDLREALEQHREDPVCRGCHEVMDELGFGLEGFDVIGASRDADSSGELPDGTTFYGAREMSDIVAQDPKLTHCITEQMFTYGLGRIPGATDERFLDEVHTEFAAGGYAFPELVVALATSAPFRHRRGQTDDSTTATGGEE